MRTREQFLRERRSGIGGSDVAAILGLSRWKTAYQVWQEKTGRVVIDEGDDERLHFGNVLEQVVADEFSARRGVKVQRRNRMFRHPEHPELIGNIDRRIVGGGILECKTADKFTRHLWGDDGSDEVPEYYLTQVQHYYTVTGEREGFLAVLIGGNEYRDYEIPYDRELAEFCAARCVEWWREHVLRDVPPPLTPGDDLSDVFRAVAGSSVTATPEIEALAAELRDAKEQRKAAEEVEKELTARLKIFMAENEVLFSRSGEKIATWKQNRDRQTVVTDWDAIAAELPVPAGIITKHTRIDVRPGARPFILK